MANCHEASRARLGSSKRGWRKADEGAANFLAGMLGIIEPVKLSEDSGVEVGPGESPEVAAMGQATVNRFLEKLERAAQLRQGI